MKTRVVITIVFVGLGLILAAIPQNTSVPYKLGANEMLGHANNQEMYYSADELADLIIQKTPLIRLIDVRPQDEYEKFALPGAYNIPLTDLLSDDYRDIVNQGDFINIFYSNGTTNALKAWMITHQLGWENNYVLQGGVNYWVEAILNPTVPPTTSANEELAKYEFRLGAKQALSGNTAISTDVDNSTTKPKLQIKRKSTKKRVQGGC